MLGWGCKSEDDALSLDLINYLNQARPEDSSNFSSLRKNEGFEQVRPGLLIRCHHSQDVADGEHTQEFLFLAQHNQVVNAVLFHQAQAVIKRHLPCDRNEL